MTLDDGIIGGKYLVCGNKLPFELERRMEALGMTNHAHIRIIQKKRSGTAVIMLRGTRFAVGKNIMSGIEVKDISQKCCEKGQY